MLGKWFGNTKDLDLKEDEVRIILPEEKFTLKPTRLLIVTELGVMSDYY